MPAASLLETLGRLAPEIFPISHRLHLTNRSQLESTMIKLTNTPHRHLASTILSKLVATLNRLPENASLQTIAAVFSFLPLDIHDVANFVNEDPKTYHRESIITTKQFELLVLTWLPGQASPIHNHAGSKCIVLPLRGFPVETVYYPTPSGAFTKTTSRHSPHSVLAGEDADIHTITNPPTAQQSLVTLHAYFPPLKNMETFSIKNRKLIKQQTAF